MPSAWPRISVRTTLTARSRKKSSRCSEEPPGLRLETLNMGKTAFVFSGQGLQYAGMGKDWAGLYPSSRTVFEQADAALGFALSEMCFNGPEEALKLTENTQPAMLTASLAIAAALASEGASPDFVAGHSLGEYTALV